MKRTDHASRLDKFFDEAAGPPIDISATVNRAGIPPSEVDEVIYGNEVSAGLGQNVARRAKGATTRQPKPSPWNRQHRITPALKGRCSRAQGVSPGLWPRRMTLSPLQRAKDPSCLFLLCVLCSSVSLCENSAATGGVSLDTHFAPVGKSVPSDCPE